MSRARAPALWIAMLSMLGPMGCSGASNTPTWPPSSNIKPRSGSSGVGSAQMPARLTDVKASSGEPAALVDRQDGTAWRPEGALGRQEIVMAFASPLSASSIAVTLCPGSPSIPFSIDLDGEAVGNNHPPETRIVFPAGSSVDGQGPRFQTLRLAIESAPPGTCLDEITLFHGAEPLVLEM